MKQANRIKVLIVDDERLVRLGLRQTISWEKYDMTVVAEAPNGSEAWNAFEEHHPELVITDIVMPIMDGIELTKKIKSVAPSTKVLVLSCHRDFEYAQQCVELGASGYVLKTAIGDGDIENQLLKIKIDIQNQQSQNSEVYSRERSSRDHSVVQWMIGLKSDEDMLELVSTHWTWVNESPVWVFLMQMDKSHKKELEDVELDFYQMMKEDQFDSIRCSDQHYLFICNEKWKDQVIKQLWDINFKIDSFRWIKRGSAHSLDQLLQCMEFVYKRMELDSVQALNHDISETIMKAVIYIDKELDKPINAVSLSDYIGLSRSHFSTLFKKEVGMSYISFLHLRRLEKAKQLLKSTDWKIVMISEKVGMPDDKHFSKWFKKNMGITPGNYRDQTKIQ